MGGIDDILDAADEASNGQMDDSDEGETSPTSDSE